MALRIAVDLQEPGLVVGVDDGVEHEPRLAPGRARNVRPQALAGRGETLRQDGVVRELLPWDLAGAQPATLRFTSGAALEAGATRHWVAVATDGLYGKPLQAVTLACGR